jgi:predicted RNase H-like HicB family nuclease
MKELFFLVEESTEGGYTARAIGEAIFTEAETKEDLKTNIKDAIKCHFNDLAELPTFVTLHFTKDEILVL